MPDPSAVLILLEAWCPPCNPGASEGAAAAPAGVAPAVSAAGAAFLIMCWIATMIALTCDAVTGERWPSVGGLFAGLILGVMLFG